MAVAISTETPAGAFQQSIDLNPSGRFLHGARGLLPTLSIKIWGGWRRYHGVTGNVREDAPSLLDAKTLRMLKTAVVHTGNARLLNISAGDRSPSFRGRTTGLVNSGKFQDNTNLDDSRRQTPAGGY